MISKIISTSKLLDRDIFLKNTYGGWGVRFLRVLRKIMSLDGR